CGETALEPSPLTAQQAAEGSHRGRVGIVRIELKPTLESRFGCFIILLQEAKRSDIDLSRHVLGIEPCGLAQTRLRQRYRPGLGECDRSLNPERDGKFAAGRDCPLVQGYRLRESLLVMEQR